MTERLGGNRNALLLSATILAIGLVVGGYLLGDGLRRSRMADRAVTVRGLAERDVTADLATWTINYSEQGTDFAAVQGGIDQDTRAITAFFGRAGFKPGDIAPAGVSVSNFFDADRGGNVITVRRKLQLRTRDVMKARAAFARQFDLIRQGVAIEEGSSPP